MSTLPGTVTHLLLAWSNGDSKALDELTPHVYDELHRLASYYLRQQSAGHTLQPTALVNEAYLRLIDSKNAKWQDRAHFLAVAARAMRHVLIDHARRYKYAKRGGGAVKVTLEGAVLATNERASDLMAVHDALSALEELDNRKSQIVELRFFGGLKINEVAEVLNISEATVQREWRTAKAWLTREMKRQ